MNIQSKPSQLIALKANAVPGMRIDVVGLAAHHQPEMERLLLHLDAHSRVSRFGHWMSDANLIEHANYAFKKATWIAGAFINKRLRGLVEMYDSGSGWAEASFVVEQDWRRRGIAWTLLQATEIKAADFNVSALRMIFARNNRPMRGLASKADGRYDVVLDEISVDVPISKAR